MGIAPSANEGRPPSPPECDPTASPMQPQGSFLVRKFSVQQGSICRGAGMLGQRPEHAVTPFRVEGLRQEERRGRDLNPRRTFQHVRDFQSRSLGHSDTSPCYEAEKEGFEPSMEAFTPITP